MKKNDGRLQNRSSRRSRPRPRSRAGLGNENLFNFFFSEFWKKANFEKTGNFGKMEFFFTKKLFLPSPDCELTSELVTWTREQCAGPIGGDYEGWIRELKRYDKSVRKCVRVWGSGITWGGDNHNASFHFFHIFDSISSKALWTMTISLVTYELTYNDHNHIPEKRTRPSPTSLYQYILNI